MILTCRSLQFIYHEIAYLGHTNLVTTNLEAQFASQGEKVK